MNQQLPKQDFDQSSSSCGGLDYLEIPAQADIRYNQDSNTSPLNLESSTQSTGVIGLYPPGPPPVFNQATTYQPDNNGSFYPSSASSHIFSSLDVRPRIGTTSSTSSSSLGHAHRAQLPNPTAQITTRDLYSTATPSFRRATDHPTRSPSFPGAHRHHPLSPTPSPNQTYTAPYKMDSGSFGGKPQIPPLMETTTFGTLQYVDGPGAGQAVKLEINGTIDKGFFLAEKEWTCYRRNYFSCICSFGVSPHYPSANMTFLQTNGQRSNVQGFSMSISAVVSDNDNHVIELVQHTPKRDKGPTARPEKVHLIAKPPQPSHHNMGGMYGTDGGMPVGSRYDHSYGPPQAGHPTEHTFERIQFKQATANNGKRRAAQQYYHLLVELWAEVGAPGGSEWHSVKVAHRKSAKMIVRGRSPGHYQSERRSSTSSGPGGSAGNLGYGGSQVMGTDFGSPGSNLLPAAYGNSYDPRSGHYGGASRHHQQHSQHDVDMESQGMSADDAKNIAVAKDYQYFPTPICENPQDPRQSVELFSHSHQRGDHETALPHLSTSAVEAARVKNEGSHHGHGTFYPGDSFYSSRCGRYEGKSSSSGYYPSLAAQASSVTMS